jgi:hypothetical protein
MLNRKKLVTMLLMLALVGLAFLVTWSQLSSCQYRESAPAVSPDGRYSYQMEFTLCENHSKSHSTLVMRKVGTEIKVVLLDLTSSIGKMNVSWKEESELVVVVPETSIVKGYGPYPEFPRVRIAHP